MILFKKSVTLSTADDKTNIVHKFNVPDNIKALKIKYEYSPKEVPDRENAIEIIKACFMEFEEPIIGRPSDYLPVKNLLTLSLDGGGEYRGASHRQSSKQEIVLSEDEATCGYIKGKITSGEWRAVISTHNISSDVTYTLEVEGEEE